MFTDDNQGTSGITCLGSIGVLIALLYSAFCAANTYFGWGMLP